MPSSFDKDQFIDEIEENSNDDKSEDENYNCLVANDEDYQLLVIKYVLEKHSFNVVTAKNGFEAFQEVQRSL